MSAIYESAKILSEYLLFHYGTSEEILPSDREWPVGMREALDFPVRTVSHFSDHDVARGLDLGCAVGRSTYEMARTCAEVIGIDFSHAFVGVANILAQDGELAYERCDEAARVTPLVARIPIGIDLTRLHFMQGDAMNLPEDIGLFDRVHAGNLLCRLQKPECLLDRLPSLVRTHGELVLATPCTWLEEYTPCENWPMGGTFEWLKAKIGKDFELVRTADEPFLIRETARKFQWTSSLVTVWRRTS